MCRFWTSSWIVRARPISLRLWARFTLANQPPAAKRAHLNMPPMVLAEPRVECQSTPLQQHQLLCRAWLEGERRGGRAVWWVVEFRAQWLETASLTTEIKVNNFHQSISSRHVNVRGKFSDEMLLSWVLVEFVVTQFNFISLILLVLAEGAQSTSCEQQSEAAPFKPEGTVPSRLALGAVGHTARAAGDHLCGRKRNTPVRDSGFVA